MIAPMRAYWETQGFRVYADPDGSDYFDLIVRRGDELGMIELKRAEARQVFEQALRRRFWGDWVGVGVGSRSAAERLAAGRAGRLSTVVGVWWVHGESVQTVRAPLPFPSRSEPREERARLTAWLDSIDRGEAPSDVRLEGLGSAIRRLGHGRAYREWTLEEAAGETEGTRQR